MNARVVSTGLSTSTAFWLFLTPKELGVDGLEREACQVIWDKVNGMQESESRVVSYLWASWLDGAAQRREEHIRRPRDILKDGGDVAPPVRRDSANFPLG